MGGAGVGAETIPSYGPVYPYKGGQDLQGQREEVTLPTGHGNENQWSDWGWYYNKEHREGFPRIILLPAGTSIVLPVGYMNRPTGLLHIYL